MAVHGTLSLLLAFLVVDEVARSVGPGVGAGPVLLAILPSTVEHLAVRVVDLTRTVALILLELTLVDLPVRPHVSTVALLFTLMEGPEEKTTIRPLEQAFALHDIVQEWPLIDLASRSDSSAVAIDLALLEEALENCVVRVDLEADTVRLECLLCGLTSIHGSTLAHLKFMLPKSLSVHIIVSIVVSKVIEWSQNLVNVTYGLVANFKHHMVVVLEGEVVVQSDHVAVQTLP